MATTKSKETKKFWGVKVARKYGDKEIFAFDRLPSRENAQAAVNDLARDHQVAYVVEVRA